jgi:hypothetical protein
MTPHELRATLDRLDLSAAEAGHLLGVHRATINGKLTPEFQMTDRTTASILGRSIGVALKTAARAEIMAVYSVARRPRVST